MAYTQVLGTCDREIVEVQVLSPALKIKVFDLLLQCKRLN